MEHTSTAGSWRALLLATAAFAICFCAWGLLSPLVPTFRELYGLSSTQAGLLVAVPVLLGSLARVPFGMMTDRFGGRVMFAGLLAFLAVPLVAAASTTTFVSLVAVALFLGVAGASFAIGVPMVSSWFPPDRQGMALGIYGMGNIGTGIAAYVAPRVAASYGWPAVFYGFVPIALTSAVVFWLLARDAPNRVRVATPMVGRLSVLRDAPLAWVLILFYFVTFGAFVAIGGLLPMLLVSLHHLAVTDAGARAGGFILIATLARPIGGYLADRWSAAIVLDVAFSIITILAVLLAFEPMMSGTTVGYLGMAAALGLGNGAVFKLVASTFPAQTGTVGGLVGAAGGLGGFFPPLVLGMVRDVTGSTAVSLMLLSEFALICLLTTVLALQRGAWVITGQPRVDAHPANGATQ